MHVTDPIAAQAELDLTTAYDYAAGVQGAILPSDMRALTRYSHHLLDYRVAMLIVGTALAN
jgi:hypothetical protein